METLTQSVGLLPVTQEVVATEAPVRKVVFNAAGDMLDADTGEMIHGANQPDSYQGGRFQVTDMSGLKYVLKKRLSKYTALMAAKAETAMVVENCKAIEQAAQTELDRIDQLFLEDLKYVAGTELQSGGKKLKSFKTPYGTVGFRSKKGGPKIFDESALLTFLITHGLTDCIDVQKTIIDKDAAIEALETLGKTDAIATCEVVLPNMVALVADNAEIPTDLFRVIPNSESFYIKHEARATSNSSGEGTDNDCD